MAAAPGLLFWLFVLGALRWVAGQPDLSPGRRFSDLKVCGDAECSSECGMAGRAAGSRVAVLAARVRVPQPAPGLGGSQARVARVGMLYSAVARLALP